MTHYYLLSGNVGKIHHYLNAPSEKADEWVNNSKNIAKVVLGIFIAFLSLPLKGSAKLLNILAREEIPQDVFNRERTAWEDKLVGGGSFSDFLVKARMRATDCGYKKILLSRWKSGNKPNFALFAAWDGKYATYLNQIVQANKNEYLCLFYGEGPLSTEDIEKQKALDFNSDPLPENNVMDTTDNERYLKKRLLKSHNPDEKPLIERNLDVLYLDRYPVDLIEGERILRVFQTH